MDIQIFFTGLTMGLSLIVAIGAQNAFVLKQGWRVRMCLPSAPPARYRMHC